MESERCQMQHHNLLFVVWATRKFFYFSTQAERMSCEQCKTTGALVQLPRNELEKAPEVTHNILQNFQFHLFLLQFETFEFSGIV